MTLTAAAVHETPPVALPLPFVTEKKDCMYLLSLPVARPDEREDQLLQRTVRETPVRLAGDQCGIGGTAQHCTEVATRSFVLFDDNRRIETLEGGVYALNLYVESQRNDPSTYYLDVNGTLSGCCFTRSAAIVAILVKVLAGAESSSRWSSCRPVKLRMLELSKSRLER